MSRQLSQFFDIGFHGDTYLIELVFAAAQRCSQFVETGANVGSSLCYLARNFPRLQCYSCEPDADAFDAARRNAAQLRNVELTHEKSPEFLHGLEKTIAMGRTLFWLDSHGYGFRWPLKEEIAFITRTCPGACVFIDDFKVPGQEQFLFDEYDGQVCGFDEIEASFKPGLACHIVYPTYHEKTSTFHPLKGWALIEFGFDRPPVLPVRLAGKARVLEWRAQTKLGLAA
jgi:hypothetical protein